jgi:hypothetical protein
MTIIIQLPTDPSADTQRAAEDLEGFLKSPEGKQILERVDDKKVSIFQRESRDTEDLLGWEKCFWSKKGFETDVVCDAGAFWNSKPSSCDVVTFLVRHARVALDQIVPFVRSRLEAAA